MPSFKHLFTPFTLGHVTLRNRIVSTPRNTHFGAGGYVTERYMRYYEEKAKGGAALLQCFGSLSVHPTAPVHDWGGIKNWDDSSLPMFRQFAETMHVHGAHVMAQITHRGRRGSSGEGEIPLLSPSDVPERLHREIPPRARNRDDRRHRARVRGGGAAPDARRDAGGHQTGPADLRGRLWTES